MFHLFSCTAFPELRVVCGVYVVEGNAVSCPGEAAAVLRVLFATQMRSTRLRFKFANRELSSLHLWWNAVMVHECSPPLLFRLPYATR